MRTVRWDRLPLEICEIIYHQYAFFTTEDLINAIIKNDLTAVKDLCKMHKKSMQMDWDLGLLTATQYGNFEMVKLMINKGAINLSSAFTIANDKKYYDNTPGRQYFDIANFIRNVMWEEDGDMWDFNSYYASF